MKTAGGFILTGIIISGDTSKKKFSLSSGRSVLCTGFVPHGEAVNIDYTGNVVEIAKGTRLHLRIYDNTKGRKNERRKTIDK